MKELIFVELNDLERDPKQPRKDFEPVALQELADSIKAQGVKQPIAVRKNPSFVAGGPKYMIIAGERRWRASGIAGKTTIPAVLYEADEELTEDAIYAHQLTENLHRVDLNPVEKAEFISGRIEYLKEQGVTNAVERVAGELGVSPSWISKNTAILKYDSELRAVARDGKLRDYSVLKKISVLKPDKRKMALQLIEDGSFVAKDFFARKRYDKKDDKEEGSEQPTDSGAAPIQEHERNAQDGVLIRLALSTEEWVRLIERTDFATLLERHDPDWRRAGAPILKSYIAKFKDWFTTSETA